MTEIERKLNAGETITDCFHVYRGDTRDVQPYIDRNNDIAFYVGDRSFSDENSQLAYRVLSNLSPRGLDIFGERWKMASGLTIKEAITENLFLGPCPAFSEQEKQHELIRYKSYMNGIATNTKDSQKGDIDYDITIPNPDKFGYKCIRISQNPLVKCSLYEGNAHTGEHVLFLAIFRGSDCEIVFFTSIPKKWVDYKN